MIGESVTDSTGSSDQYFIARKVIKIGSLIYRKLNKEKQFLYTLVQDHSIWSNEQFWIEHFFHQHQRRLVAHYRRQATTSTHASDKSTGSPSKTEESFHGPENAHHGDGDSENFLVCSEMMDNTEVRIDNKCIFTGTVTQQVFWKENPEKNNGLKKHSYPWV